MKNHKKIKVNLSNTSYPVLPKSVKALGWAVADGPEWDIAWQDGSVSLSHLSKMKSTQKINHFPGMFEISRKNCLAKNLNRFRETFPNDYDFYPQTWLIPQDLTKLRSLFGHSCPNLIVKPEASSQGKGIFLIDKWEELAHVKNSIAQVYIPNPLLIDGLKFDLRIYVLVAGCDPLRLYIHEEGLARFATELYSEPDSANKVNRFMHLTNYAINKLNSNFVQNDDGNSASSHKRSLSSVLKDLENQGKDSAGLWDDICDLVIKTLITAQPFLASTYKSAQSHDYFNGMCFEVLGFDVLVDSSLRPWLLEVNFTPSFTTDSALDFRIKTQIIQDCLRTVSLGEKERLKLDKLISNYPKKRSMKTKQEIAEIRFFAQEIRDRFEEKNCGGFIKVYPGDDQFCYSRFFKYSQVLWTGGLIDMIYVPRRKKLEGEKMKRGSSKGSLGRLGIVRKVLNFDSIDTTHSRSKSYLSGLSCDSSPN